MANELAGKIRQLTSAKIDFVDDQSETVLKDVVSSALELDEIAEVLVDLANIFDDLEMPPEDNDRLNMVVGRLLKTGTDEQKAAAKELFVKTLGYGLKAKATNTYFDELRNSDPGEPAEEEV